MRRTAFALLPMFAAAVFVTVAASAQSTSFSVKARQAPLAINPGATATLVVIASNGSAAEGRVTPSVDLPQGWQVVTGLLPLTLGAGEAEALVVSIAAPASATAAAYPVRIWVAFDGVNGREAASDSLVVTVREHRSIALVLIDKPPYVVAGDKYEARLLVLNRGNSAADVTLAARSSRGRALTSSVPQLAPGTSQEVKVTVQLRSSAAITADEVLEVTAAHAADNSANGQAAARIPIIPRAGRLDGYTTISSMLRLRAVGQGGGVAPFDISGGGRLTEGGSTELYFSATGRTRGVSRSGERESYRVELRSDRYRVRAGDHLYTLSPLTGAGQGGVGASVEGSTGIFGAGAFSQRFRSAPTLGTEYGAFVSVQSPGSPRARMTLNLVDRSHGQFEGKVASSEISFRPNAATLVDAEYATTGANAAAYNTRISGRFGAATIDMGYHRADTAFKGPQRGSSHDYLDMQAPVTDRIRLAAFASRSATRLDGSDSASSNAFANTGISATLDNRLTLELSSLRRSVAGITDDVRSVRVRSDMSFGLLSLTGDAKVGFAKDPVTGATSLSRQMSVAPRFRLGRQSLAAHFGVSDVSNSPTAKEAVTTAGLDLTARVGPATEIGVSGFGSHVASTGWIAQSDLRVSQRLASGVSVSARAHLVSRRQQASATTERSSFYLEVGVPMRVPVFPRLGPGRVYGRVSDAATGRPLSHALVRVGPRLGVTDRNGTIALTGVAPGEHRISLGEDTTLAASVLSGSTTIRVDSTKRRAARFNVVVARGAGVQSEIRRMAVTRTALDADDPDSLVDAGPMQNMVVALAGARDTLYQTTDTKGKVSFTDVPAGSWVLTIVGADVPLNHVFDRQTHELSLEPGQTVSTAFRLVPRRRAVQMIASENAVPASSRPATAVTANR